MRQQIITEIKRVAADTGGRPPGRRVFERETGIKPSTWLGVFWARWGDALREAGFEPNELQGRSDSDNLLRAIVAAVRYFGHVPTNAELRLYGRSDATFPAHSTISNHFPEKGQMIDALRRLASDESEFADIAALLPAGSISVPARPIAKPPEGHVYLIQSGSFYKVGRSDELERRVKEIKVALPDKAMLIHSIRTDDPAGIEAYWHRRFADRRANGEWFRLTPADLAAFRRRSFQ